MNTNTNPTPTSKTPLYKNKWVRLLCKLVLAVCAGLLCYFLAFFILLFLSVTDIHIVLVYIGMFLPAALLFPLIFVPNKKAVLKWWAIGLGVFTVAFGINKGIRIYQDSITVNTSPNINVQEYLPFEEDSKIVTLDHPASLQLTEDLPILDGAAAVFPVYSAFVNATYPDHVGLQWDGKLNREGPFR